MAAATRKASNARVPRSKAYTAGLKIRQRWLGKAYVDKAFRDADDFTLDLQHFVTEHGWGASWARGVLPLKTRAFMNLAMISALNRPHELRAHLKGALTNGVSFEVVAVTRNPRKNQPWWKPDGTLLPQPPGKLVRFDFAGIHDEIGIPRANAPLWTCVSGSIDYLYW
jgi:4-carboxymuconolactone decarboxylase